MLRKQLDRVAPTFEQGGKLEVLWPLYDAIDTFLYTCLLYTSDAADD